MSNVYDFTQGRRHQRSQSQQSQAFGSDKQQRRRHLVDQIEQQMKERPKISELGDRKKVAENLHDILEEARDKHGVRISRVLEAVDKGPSTKYFNRFARKSDLSGEERDGQDPKSLHATIADYRRIAEEAAKQSGQDEDAALINLVRGSSYHPETSDIPVGNVPEWAFVLSDMLTKMATSVAKECDLECYFSEIEYHSLWLTTNEEADDPEHVIFETDIESCYEQIDDVLKRLSLRETGVFKSREEYLSFNLFPYVWIGDIVYKTLKVKLTISRDQNIDITNCHIGDNSKNDLGEDIPEFRGSLQVYRQLFILLARYGIKRDIVPLFATFPRAELNFSKPRDRALLLDDDDRAVSQENDECEPFPPPGGDELSDEIYKFVIDDVSLPKSDFRKWIPLEAKENDLRVKAWYRINTEGSPPSELREGFAFQEVTPRSCFDLLGQDWVFGETGPIGLTDNDMSGEAPTMSEAPYRTLASLIERNLYYMTGDERLDHLLRQSARDCCKRFKDWREEATTIMKERQNALRSEWTGVNFD